MHTLVAPSILRGSSGRKLSRISVVRDTVGSLRARSGRQESCAVTKGSVRTWSIRGRLKWARKRWAMGKRWWCWRIAQVQYCWSQSTRVVSFYERQKRQRALKGRTGRANANVWISIRQHEPESKSRCNEHEWAAVISADLTDAVRTLQSAPIFDYGIRAQEGLANDGGEVIGIEMLSRRVYTFSPHFPTIDSDTEKEGCSIERIIKL